MRQIRSERYCVSDSRIQTTAVAAPRISSCCSRSSTPNNWATMLSESRTTMSIATPISSSGAMSKSLLSAVRIVPRTIRAR